MGILDIFKRKKTTQTTAAPQEIKLESKESRVESSESIVKGYNYLYESQDWQSFYSLIPAIAKERKTICITGKNPDILRKSYKMEDAEIIWVTNIETEHRCAAPERIEFELTQNVLQFMKANEGSTVFVDDLEFLTVCTDFAKTMDFMKALGDTSAYTTASVILHIMPGFFSDTETSLLKSIFDRTIPPKKPESGLSEATSYLISRMPYKRVADIVKGSGEGNKLIISLVHPDKLKPFFGTENTYYFLTNTEQNIPVVRPWATETDFIIALKKYIEDGGRCAVIDGLECVYSSVDFKRFLTFVKDMTDIASREKIKIFCVLNESILKSTEVVALKQRFDRYVSQ